jgi:NAD(P)-dependent dehydrogenase (short-subunit alcohol dehydrogenase family)
MQKTIFVTDSTDGIGLETATILVSQGHNVLLHGPTRQNWRHGKQRSLR